MAAVGIGSYGLYHIFRISWRDRVKIAHVFGPSTNWSPSAIRRKLAEEGRKFLPSTKAIAAFIRRWKQTDSLVDRPQPGRPSSFMPHQLDWISRTIQKSPDIQTKALLRQFCGIFDLPISRKTVVQ